MTKKQETVSIALATYNGEKYLREQIDSFFSQTYENLEIIVSDDCSTDSTLDILKEYKKSHKLKYSVNKKNLGFVKNFEKAVSMCKGEYIALADQDDIWMPQKIEKLVNHIGDYSLACSDSELIDENGNVFSHSFQRYSNNYIADEKQFEVLVFRNFVVGCTSLLKKDFIDKVLPIPDGVHHHDWWFALTASIMNGIKYIDEPLIRYRQHSENDTGVTRKNTIFQKIREFKSKSNSNVFNKEIVSLKAVLTSPLFTNQQNSLIRKRLQFYEDILNTRIHIKSGMIAFKYRNFMLAGRNPVYKLFFILGSFFGN